MRNLFTMIAFLFLGFALTGCYDNHGRPVPVLPMGDAGPMPTGDAGWPLPTDDAGPMPAEDGGTPSDAVLTIIFDGPAAGVELRGTQDVVMYRFTLIAREHLEIRSVPFMLEGLTADDRVRGSLGTEYFRDLKVKDLDTGRTVMGPISLDSGSFSEPFTMMPGETRHLLITMDLANSEDAFGEFYGDSDNHYRVTVGDDAGHFFPSDGVRLVATGEFVASEAIETNVRIPGNEINVVDATLAVNMAATPALTRAVSHELMIPSVGLVFTAAEASDVLIRSVRLTGRGDVDGFTRAEDLNDVVTACALFDGETQVGRAQSPDAVTGEMRITDVNFPVPAGSSVTLTARCTADSVVEGDFDIYALGIADEGDIEAEREDGNPVFATVSSSLLNNVHGAPSNFVTVFPHGEVTVAAENLRQSTILVAGPDFWQNFAQYRVTAQREGVDMDVVRVHSTGEAASFNMVAVAVDGALLGTCILPAGTDRDCDVHLSSPLRVERDSSRVFQLWSRLSYVVSSASVGGATTGVARSGNRLRLGLAADVERGDWDVNYVGMLNVRFTGRASGHRLYEDGPGISGNEFIVRRSKPTFTRQALVSTLIRNGSDHDLYRFRVSADSAGSVGLMGFRFRVAVTGSGTVSSLGIRRVGSPLDVAGATVARSGEFITVTFSTEETITGSGTSYTLHGVLDGFIAGDTVSLTPFRNLSDDTALTGGVGPDGQLNTLRGWVAGMFHTGILWSDLSEVPHTDTAWTSSLDWTGDRLVEDMTQTSTLSL